MVWGKKEIEFCCPSALCQESPPTAAQWSLLPSPHKLGSSCFVPTPKQCCKQIQDLCSRRGCNIVTSVLVLIFLPCYNVCTGWGFFLCPLFLACPQYKVVKMSESHKGIAEHERDQNQDWFYFLSYPPVINTFGHQIDCLEKKKTRNNSPSLLEPFKAQAEI